MLSGSGICFPTPCFPHISRVNPRLFPFDVEALFVECTVKNVNSMPACPRNSLTNLAMLVHITGS